MCWIDLAWDKKRLSSGVRGVEKNAENCQVSSGTRTPHLGNGPVPRDLMCDSFSQFNKMHVEFDIVTCQFPALFIYWKTFAAKTFTGKMRCECLFPEAEISILSCCAKRTANWNLSIVAYLIPRNGSSLTKSLRQ